MGEDSLSNWQAFLHRAITEILAINRDVQGTLTESEFLRTLALSATGDIQTVLEGWVEDSLSDWQAFLHRAFTANPRRGATVFNLLEEDCRQKQDESGLGFAARLSKACDRQSSWSKDVRRHEFIKTFYAGLRSQGVRGAVSKAMIRRSAR